MNRRHRIAAALLAAIGLVFAQLAVAAHACDISGDAEAAATPSTNVCCVELAGDGGPSSRTGVCVEHCGFGASASDASLSATAMVEGPYVAVRARCAGLATTPMGELRRGLDSPVASAPVMILFGTLRI